MEEEKLLSNSNDKKINSDELKKLLLNPPEKLIEDSGEYATISLVNYIIEDEYIILDEDINLNQRLIFKRCTFNCENSLFIDGAVFNDYVTFEECTFSKGIFFQGGTFKKELCLKYVHTSHIHLSRGSFQKISISCYDIDRLWVSDAKFETLYIGEYLVNNTIKKFTLFGRIDKVGNIIARGQTFDEIFISGTNKDRKFNFENIKCNNVLISNFTNDGILNFYGIRPKDLADDNRYFQIIKSNLDKAQFFRAFFSKYKELIIIDSFISDCLFIGCRWSNNVRALDGPGHGTFEESLATGRKGTINEYFAIKEAYRQLKISMSKHSDRIQENRFYAEELNFHNKTLKWKMPWENQFWDKLTLYWSKTFSDYGQSFIKPLFWLLFGHWVLFLIALLLHGFAPLHISFCNPTSLAFQDAFEKYFIYINPLRKIETTLSGYLIILDILMRIWSSYMIYNLIRASRRFIA